MSFRIKDLMISVLPFREGEGKILCSPVSVVCPEFSACPDVSVVCQDASACPDVSGVCPGASVCPEIFGSLYADNCTRCTDLGSCDAGCTRVQCSWYDTNNMLLNAFTELRDAELELLRAELKLALIGIERRPSPQQIDLLEKHLEEALEELRGQRDQLKNK